MSQITAMQSRNQQGKKADGSVWCGKYLCGCGTVRRSASGGEHIFLCYSQSMNGSGEGCSLRTVLEWKLDMIAYHVIRDVWRSREADVS